MSAINDVTDFCIDPLCVCHAKVLYNWLAWQTIHAQLYNTLAYASLKYDDSYVVRNHCFHFYNRALSG